MAFDMRDLTVNHGLRRLAKAKYKDVHTECIAAINTDVKNPIPYFLLGVIAFDHKNFSKALELFAKAESFDRTEPYYPAYHAMTFSTLRQSNQAREKADEAVKIMGEDAHLRDMLGVIYSRCGFHAAAVEQFKQAVKINHEEPNYFFNLAASQQFLGDFEQAEIAYRTVLSLNPGHHRAWSSLISLRKQTPQTQKLNVLTGLFESANVSTDAKLHFGHAIAKTLEDLGRFEDSLDWLLKAKADKRAEFPFDRESASALFSAAKATSLNQDTAVPRHQDTVPIFVVGLPRTGTTLVDRILSSHSQVKSAGELNAFAEQIKILTNTPTPFVLDAETLKAATRVTLKNVAENYLKQTASLAAGAPHMVDKMPLNFFYAGLMLSAFPKVKIIALRRGAMDSCVSNFRQLFSTQFSYYNYTFDLDDTAYFYGLFDDLMAHWREVLPANRFMEVHYEDIVQNQEIETRRLLSFCDLDWEDACLRFHENAAAVSTASSVQVRQPLYSGSIGRWKKYGTKLDGLQTALGSLGS